MNELRRAFRQYGLRRVGSSEIVPVGIVQAQQARGCGRDVYVSYPDTRTRFCGPDRVDVPDGVDTGWRLAGCNDYERT